MAATAAASGSSQSAERAESVRDDLRRFLRGATHESRVSQTELTHTALKLLRSLPAARQAGLEYLSTVLDECTAQFVAKLEVRGDTAAGMHRNGRSMCNEDVTSVYCLCIVVIFEMCTYVIKIFPLAF